MKESIPIQLELLDEKVGKVVKIKRKEEKEGNLLRKSETSTTIDVSDLPRGKRCHSEELRTKYSPNHRLNACGES